jgi:hypothetical protein
LLQSFEHGNLLFLEAVKIKKRSTTEVSQDLGFRLNLKFVLYLGILCLTENKS